MTLRNSNKQTIRFNEDTFRAAERLIPRTDQPAQEQQHLGARQVSGDTGKAFYICLHECMNKAKYRQISEDYYLVTWDNGDWKILHADKILEDYLPITEINY